ncbi:MAG: hypothetical protein HQM08_17440 [Candidatus Riflebacteria bacterium]|nr:hypothetical protein [Candidatus Riflebacteria bacterium]
MTLEMDFLTIHFAPVYSLQFGEIQPGITNLPTLFLKTVSEIDYDDLRLTAVCSARHFQTGADLDEGAEAMAEKWLAANIPGYNGGAPSGWVPIGGDPTVMGNYLSIPKLAVGENVPIRLRLNIPSEVDTIGEFSISLELYYKVSE